MDTDAKLDKIYGQFPYISRDTLLEILVACNGRISGVVDLLKEDRVSAKRGRKATTRDLMATRDLGSDLGSDLESKKEPQRKRVKVEDQKTGNQISAKTGFALTHHPLPSYRTQKVVTLYTKQEVESLFPNLHFVPNFLPKELADKVLDDLVSKRAQFSHNEFHIAGRKCTSTHYSTVYENGIDAGHVFEKKSNNQFFPDLKVASYAVEDKVNEVLSEREKLAEWQIQQGWKANFCVANMFENAKQHLDWHSDKLDNIGPLPTIASISLGATRIFRLRKEYDTGDSKYQGGSAGTIFNIPLPHNSLLIMLPGTQEEFKHCVPSLEDCIVKEHPRYGKLRFNLTFRMKSSNMKGKRPTCPVCHHSMHMRRMYKDPATRGYYFWLCQSDKECPGFYYAKFDGGDVYTKKIQEAAWWISKCDRAAAQSVSRG